MAMSFTQSRRRSGTQGLNGINLLRQASAGGRSRTGFGEIDYNGTMHPAFATGEALSQVQGLFNWAGNGGHFRPGMGAQSGGMQSGGGMLPGVSAPGMPPGVMQMLLASAMGNSPPIQAGPNLGAQTQAYMPQTYGDFNAPPAMAPVNERMGGFLAANRSAGAADPAGPYGGFGGGGGGLARFQSLAGATPAYDGPQEIGAGQRFGTSVTVQMPDGRTVLMPYAPQNRTGGELPNDVLLGMMQERSSPEGIREGSLQGATEGGAQDMRYARSWDAMQRGTGYHSQSPSQMLRSLTGSAAAQGIDPSQYGGDYDSLLGAVHQNTLEGLAQRRQDLQQQRQQFLDEVSPELRRERFLSRQANAALRRRAMQEEQAARGGAEGGEQQRQIRRPLSLNVPPGTEGGPTRTQQVQDFLRANPDATIDDFVNSGFTREELQLAEAELRGESGGQLEFWRNKIGGMMGGDPSTADVERDQSTNDVNRLREMLGQGAFDPNSGSMYNPLFPAIPFPFLRKEWFNFLDQ